MKKTNLVLKNNAIKKSLKPTPIIYQATNGALELKGDFKNETLWATQAQMAAIFGVNTQAITKHIKNIYIYVMTKI